MLAHEYDAAMKQGEVEELFGLVAGTLRVAAGGLWPCLLMHIVWGTMTTAHFVGR